MERTVLILQFALLMRFFFFIFCPSLFSSTEVSQIMELLCFFFCCHFDHFQNTFTLFLLGSHKRSILRHFNRFRHFDICSSDLIITQNGVTGIYLKGFSLAFWNVYELRNIDKNICLNNINSCTNVISPFRLQAHNILI